MTEQQPEYITDAMEMMGAGYDQPAAVIDPPRTVKALRDSGLADYKVWGWVKKSAKFISHIKILKGSKLAIWDVISLSIGEDGSCRLSAPEIADLTGYSVSEVRQSIGELDEMGYLSVIRTNGKRNIYKPEFAARGANNPTDNPSKKTTPPVAPLDSADDPSSPSIENSAPSISRVKVLKEKKKAAKPPTPPEIVLYKSVVKRYPNAAVYDEVSSAIKKVSARLGRTATADDLLPFFRSWCTKSNNIYNFSVWLMEWAVNGTTGQQVKQTKANTSADALEKYAKENGVI
jgi:hypothetical protein